MTNDGKSQSNGNTPIPADGFLRLPEVLRFIPVSRSTWWAGVKSGRYPGAVKLGPRITAWKAADIRALVDAKR
jgi:prophage regulatory protein